MRVIVCGGREYRDRKRVYGVLDSMDKKHGFTTVIHGGARGADQMAGEWAISRGKTVMCMPADWEKYGKAAGHKRNQRMIDVCAPDACIAFPGGAGTADMVARARKAGLKVKEIK